MGKLWKITIFNGKTMENHHFSWENYGKTQFFMGKLAILMGKSQFLMGKSIINGDLMLIQW